MSWCACLMAMTGSTKPAWMYALGSDTLWEEKRRSCCGEGGMGRDQGRTGMVSECNTGIT
jgi:hypothetical protein